MDKIIVADIFGTTPALIELSDAISANKIIDPYDGKIMEFENESQAYRYFTENVGLDVYVEQLSQIIKKCSGDVTLIGFSVGASAIWQLSESTPVRIINVVKRAICFYGSQIRHQTNLSPKFDVRLIFPRRELHFDVQALKCALANKPRVTIEQVDFLHGFMNYHSENFNSVGYKKYLALLLNDISR